MPNVDGLQCLTVSQFYRHISVRNHDDTSRESHSRFCCSDLNLYVPLRGNRAGKSRSDVRSGDRLGYHLLLIKCAALMKNMKGYGLQYKICAVSCFSFRLMFSRVPEPAKHLCISNLEFPELDQRWGRSSLQSCEVKPTGPKHSAYSLQMCVTGCSQTAKLFYKETFCMVTPGCSLQSRNYLYFDVIFWNCSKIIHNKYFCCFIDFLAWQI